MPLLITGTLMVVGVVAGALFVVGVPVAFGLLIHAFWDAHRASLAERSLEAHAFETAPRTGTVATGVARRVAA